LKHPAYSASPLWRGVFPAITHSVLKRAKEKNKLWIATCVKNADRHTQRGFGLQPARVDPQPTKPDPV